MHARSFLNWSRFRDLWRKRSAPIVTHACSSDFKSEFVTIATGILLKSLSSRKMRKNSMPFIPCIFRSRRISFGFSCCSRMSARPLSPLKATSVLISRPVFKRAIFVIRASSSLSSIMRIVGCMLFSNTYNVKITLLCISH